MSARWLGSELRKEFVKRKIYTISTAARGVYIPLTELTVEERYMIMTGEVRGGVAWVNSHSPPSPLSLSSNSAQPSQTIVCLPGDMFLN